MDVRDHWNRVYTTKSGEQVSWFEPLPAVSLKMLDAAGVNADTCVLDVGGGPRPSGVPFLDRHGGQGAISLASPPHLETRWHCDHRHIRTGRPREQSFQYSRFVKAWGTNCGFPGGTVTHTARQERFSEVSFPPIDDRSDFR